MLSHNEYDEEACRESMFAGDTASIAVRKGSEREALIQLSHPYYLIKAPPCATLSRAKQPSFEFNIRFARAQVCPQPRSDGDSRFPIADRFSAIGHSVSPTLSHDGNFQFVSARPRRLGSLGQ